jgi:hypothetical protein
MADFLDEDIEIRNQKYCVLSYTLPPPGGDPKGKKRIGFDTPMLKIRGSYSSVEECEQRIQKLKTSDTYFNMYVATVGTWGPLLTEEQHEKTGTDAVFMDKEMNDFMKGYKESQEKSKEEFEKRKDELVEKAKFDGSKEGQEILANKKENPISVMDRIQKTKELITDLTTKLSEAQELYDSSVKLIGTYTQEEIDTARLEIKTNALKIEEIQ